VNIILKGRIEFNDNVKDVIIKMSDGNPGALRVLMEMLQKEDGLLNIFILDDMNIYGSRIWVGYKDICNYDLDKYFELIKKRDSIIE